MINRRSFTKLLAFSAPVLGSKAFGAPEIHAPPSSYQIIQISDKVQEGPYVAGEDIEANSLVFLRGGKLYKCKSNQPRGIVEQCSPAGSGAWMVTRGCVNVRLV